MKQSGNIAGKILIAASVAASAIIPAPAQRLSGVGENNKYSPSMTGSISRAREMTRCGNYTGAADQLRRLRDSGTRLTASEKEECDYLLACALYESGDRACLSYLDAFARDYPASERAMQARLMAADYFYFNLEFGPAAARYGETGISGLDPENRSLYTFREALSLLKSGMADEAERKFGRLRQNPAYRARADFYLAYIDYSRGNLDEAYRKFKAAEGLLPDNAEVSKRISRGLMPRKDRYEPTGYEASYYIAQIEFTRGEYARVADTAHYLLNHKLVPELRPELERILGESCYRLGDVSGAKTYIEDYVRHSRENGAVTEPTARYALGAVLYESGDYRGAETQFQTLTEERSEIGQGAWLYLGQIAVRDGDYGAAAVDFEKAYRMSYDRKVAETALYNYAVARTRGANVPFSSSIDMLEEFLRNFPNSKYSAQVEEYLATAYFHEKNYAKAMESIERISNPSEKVLEAKQKVAFELGAEAMSGNNPGQAAHYMRLAASMKDADSRIACQANLWLGDALYAGADYRGAAEAYRKFLASSPRDANRTLGLYNLAYTLYMQADYNSASREFTAAIGANPPLPGALRTDAVIRRADCLYYCGDTRQAMESYSEAIEAGAADSDYALLRRALMNGINGDTEAKIADLDQLAAKYPESKWSASGMLEKGLALNDIGKTQQAAETLRSVADRYPSSPEARKGLLNLAIIYADKGHSDESIDTYRRVIEKWPSSEEAGMAHEDLRKLYASRGELEAYASWLNRIPGAPRIKADDMERLAFDAAERALSADPADTRRLEKYISDYPSGSNIAQALIDLAETYYDAGKADSAFGYAERLLLSRPQSPQAPRALLLKATILEDKGAGEHALQTYRELESAGGADFAADAYAGIMRTTGDAAERYEYARRLGRSGGISADRACEASLYEALALKDMGQKKRAEELLSEVSANLQIEAGARAAVELGEMYLGDKRWKDAESVLSRFTDAGTQHQYWLARGFISLADAYAGQGKTYLAIEYLNSLKQNYPGKEKDIAEMISGRLRQWKK